jgi:hypothetical protein
MVITGHVLPSLYSLDKQIYRRQKPINELYKQWWPERRSLAKPVQRKPAYERPLDMGDTELLDSARRARKTGAKFQKLYDRGDWSGYKSQSQADYVPIVPVTVCCSWPRLTHISVAPGSTRASAGSEQLSSIKEMSMADISVVGTTLPSLRPQSAHRRWVLVLAAAKHGSRS